MTRGVRALLPVLWTLLIGVPCALLCAYLVESVYGVPLRAGSFRFERPWAGLLLGGAVLVLVARGWMHRRAAPRFQVSRAGDARRAGPGRRVWLRHGLTGMRVTAVALMALGLMGPQSIHARNRSPVHGIDIVLVLDMSLSMRAADIEPNRFAATKSVVGEFIRRRPDDRIGAVVFGRQAYTLLPLTTDKSALRDVVHRLELGAIDGRGTAIGNAVGTGLNRLRGSHAKSKVVILLTDGNSNAGNVSPAQAAELGSTLGVKVYTVLMGRSGEAKVKRGTDLFGRPVWDTGNFPVNPKLLEEMAHQTGGEHFRATNRKALEQSFHQILDRLEKTEIEDVGRVYGELFPAFVGPAVALLALELIAGTWLVRRWP